MGSILASEVIKRASVLLEDQGFATWTADELLGWLNDGQIQIVTLRPDAKVRVTSAQLEPGTKQSIGEPDLRVLDIPRNLGLDGSTPGRVIRFLAREELDLTRPDWHARTPDPVVQNWIYDQRAPEVWWCYPPQPDPAGYVELITSALPVKITASQPIDIADSYLNPLVSWIVYRAFSRDNEYTQPGGKAELAQREFMSLLGIKTEAERKFRPEKSQPPHFMAPPAGNQGAFGEGR